MATPDLTLKAGDTWPPVHAVLEQAKIDPDTWEPVLDANGDQTWEPIDLTDADTIHMWIRADGVVAKSTGPVELDTPDGDDDDPTNGKVRYAWAAGDTSTPGLYRVEWEITWGDGTVQTVASGGYGLIEILEQLDPTEAT